MGTANTYDNILEWRAARAKYEAELRNGSVVALDFIEKRGGRSPQEAIAEFENIIQYDLEMWEQHNIKPIEE